MKIFALFFLLIFILVSAEPVWSQNTSAENNIERFVPVPPELEGFQVGALAAFVWDGSHGANEWNEIYDDYGIFIDYGGDFFGISISFGITSQNKFGTAPNDHLRQGPRALGDHWFELNEGTLYLANGPVYLYGGFNANQDIVNTPYSLFFSPNDIASLNAAIGYQDGIFGAKSLWLGLNGPTNVISATQRGANYKEYSIQIGDFRFGYQDWVVYHEEFFSPLYFLIPIPAVIIEQVYAAGLNPNYTQPDSNTMLGAFFEYNDGQLYIPVQLMIDDITFYDILKLGWSVGISYRSEIGTFGFYHAGATKHTYSSAVYDQENEQSYRAFTYFPTNRYGPNDARRTLWYFDNYFVYRHGENNLAFMLDYAHRLAIVDLRVALEYVVSGSKSPLVPWHGGRHDQQSTTLLDEELLSHTISLTLDLDVDVFEDVIILFQGTIGLALNELKLNNSNIFAPVSGTRLLHYLFIGAQYNYNTHTPQWRTTSRIPYKR